MLAAVHSSRGYASSDSGSGLKKDAVFTNYTPASGNAEIIRRMLSPLAAMQIPVALARSGTKLSDQPVNLAAEKFIVYTPPREPTQGYGLLVFVPPWNESVLPTDWVPVLDQFGLIFVSAARSGNDQSVLGRRYPLAVLAEYNIAKQFRLDAARIYIAGFSGGSRVALRVALAYPDIFRGAILNASSDPIGDEKAPIPPRDLFFRFQESMHLVYVTGDRDILPKMNDRISMRSMRNWCVFDVDSYMETGMAHDTMTASALTRALEFLSSAAERDENKLADCRTDIENELNAGFQDAQSLVAAGKRDQARQKLLEIDARFGGLAAPRTLQVMKQLGAN
jgi:pimeloyl-ACP methyl ester carboxylesterase